MPLKISRKRASITALLLLTVAAYSNALVAALPFDAGALVRDDSRVQAVTTENVRAILTQNYWGKRFQSGLYRPLVSLSYLVQHGAPPWEYHAVNLLLHLIAVLLVYGLFRQVFTEDRVAFWGSLIWAVHPINTEAVTNVAGRPDLLAAIGVLGALLLYAKLRSPFGIFLLTLLGVFSKESAVVVLPLALLYDWSVRRKPNRDLLFWMALPIGLMLAVRAALSISCGMAHPYVDNPLIGMPWLEAKLTAVGVAGKLTALWFWPSRLSADYSYGQIQAGRAVFWPLLGLFAVSGVILLAFRARRPLGFLGGFFAIALLPTANLLFLTGSIMAERFLYLPGIGLAGLAAYGLSQLSYTGRNVNVREPSGQPKARNFGTAQQGFRRRDKEVTALLLWFVLVFGLRTFVRNRDYRDDLAFWSATAQTSPNSFKAHTQLAAELYRRGDLRGALHEADRVREILGPVPDRWNAYEPWTDLFGYYSAAGDAVKTREAAERVAAIFTAAPRCERGCTP